MKKMIHMIPNAHLDPVWLWDGREGLNAGIATCRAVLDLMDDFPDLTFIRGEAAVYAHIAKYDPACFRRIRRRVAEGRWDVVGGTSVQPDTNLPATETFIRHFLHGIRYFQEHLGVRVRAGWAADSFGHCAGLPDILVAAGITSYAFTRPGAPQLVLAKPAFWWVGTGGGRVLGYRPPVGWYGSEREEMPRRLDAVREYAASSDLCNIGCFYGLGNHGGGPSRRQVEDIRRWADSHPDVRVMHSTLHRLFAALAQEAAGQPRDFLPVQRGEMNFCLRGCHASVAKFKFSFRKAEADLLRAEVTDTAIAAGLRRTPAELRAAWDGVLFNSFHDILPGTSIERAFDDQLDGLGHVRYVAGQAETNALNRLAARVDTTVPAVRGDRPTAVPLLVWNPHAHPFEGHVELEASLDGRPLWAYSDRVHEVPLEVRNPDGQRVAFQVIPTEHTALVQLAWRKRVAVPVKLPPLGWAVYTLAYVEGAPAPAAPVIQPPCTVRNEFLAVVAKPGSKAVVVCNAERGELTRIGAVTVEDPWGAWGGMGEEAESCDLTRVRWEWRITAAEVLEQGPECRVLAVALAGGKSQMELRLTLWRGRKALDVTARVLWNERSARLKLNFTGAGATAEYQVPGGTVVRPPCGEVAGGRWVRTGALGFASDALYSFNLHAGCLSATVCRASRYANDSRMEPEEAPWLPAVDRGELKFRCLVTSDLASLARLAAELERPPVVLPVPAAPGRLPRKGSLMHLQPAALEMIALKPAGNDHGVILRARSARPCRGSVQWLGRRVDLGRVRAGEIATWRITRGGMATRLNAMEEPMRAGAGPVCERAGRAR